MTTTEPGTTGTVQITGISGAKALAGVTLGPSAPIPVTQTMIDDFAELTGDRQWIHVDVERARRESPFGGPIAHGLLTLSLLPKGAGDLYAIDDTSFGAIINYGFDKVRYPAPVPAGAQLETTVEIVAVDDIPGGVQMKQLFKLTVVGGDKPSCVAEMLIRLLDKPA